MPTRFAACCVILVLFCRYNGVIMLYHDVIMRCYDVIMVLLCVMMDLLWSYHEFIMASLWGYHEYNKTIMALL